MEYPMDSEAWRNGEPVPPNVTQKWFLLEDDFHEHAVDDSIAQARLDKYIREHADTSRRLPWSRVLNPIKGPTDSVG
ncbi:hypothetical protein FVER14953_20746 [Fusarium verticillioides]|nr:hypothetical protein FVER14953_20746 [Fusarium verticillioides]